MMASKSQEEIQKNLQTLKEWMSSQPQLPNDLGDKLLLRFLHSCYHDLEKTKITVQLFCTIRANASELLDNRDPLSDKIQKTLQIVNLAQLNISNNRKLWIWQLNDPGLDRYDYIQDAKVFFLSTDAWLLSEDEGLEDEDIVVLDVKDISLKFLTKFSVSVARKLTKYQEEALPIRLKQIHLVNAPPFIDTIYSLIKPFMKQDHIDMVHFHAPKSETLHQYISKDELPEDYGGNGVRMEEHMKAVVESINSKREYFLRNDLWKAKVVKKSKKKTESPDTEVTSFRSLAID